MKITVCGSIKFYDEMLETKDRLEELGHGVILPPSKIIDEDGNEISPKEYYDIRKNSDEPWIWDRKNQIMIDFFKDIEGSDAILVLNLTKNGVEGYVGGNTLMEIGIAMHLKKKIFLMNKIPEISYKEEIVGAKPTVINGDLKRIE